MTDDPQNTPPEVEIDLEDLDDIGALIEGDDEDHETREAENERLKSELRTLRAEKEKDAAELAKFRQAERVAKAAEIAGFKPKFLGRLLASDGLEVTFSEKDVDGASVATVSVKQADGTVTALVDYAERHWGEFLAALKVGDDTTNAGRARVGTPPPKSPVRMRRQPGQDESRRLPSNYEQLLNSGRYNT